MASEESEAIYIIYDSYLLIGYQICLMILNQMKMSYCCFCGSGYLLWHDPEDHRANHGPGLSCFLSRCYCSY